MDHSTLGADIESAVPTPTLDLTALVAAVNQALAPPDAASGPPFLRYDRRQQHDCLCLDTRAVLQRLKAEPLAASDSFLSHLDFTQQPSWQTIRVGGRIVPGTDLALRNAVLALTDRINAEFDALCARDNVPPSHWVIDNVEAELRTMAERVNGHLDRLEPSAFTRVQTITFAEPNAPELAGQSLIGRVMSAMETSETGDPLEGLLDAVRRRMSQTDADDDGDGWLPEEIDQVLADWRIHYQRADSQVREFFNFLPDAAQSRVRMAVAQELMEAIRQIAIRQPDAEDSLLAAEYLRRISALYQHFIAPDADPEFQLESVYGSLSGADFLLSTELVKVGFQTCLPVWCFSATQLFEASTAAADHAPVIGQISYHFKINGYHPEKHQGRRETAFQRKVRELREILLPEAETPPRRLSRPLAELLTLAIVIPRTAEPNDWAREADVPERVRKAVALFNAEGRPMVARTLESLEKRCEIVPRIAHAVIRILQRPGPIIDRMARRPRAYYLNVLPGILHREAAFQGLAAPLVKPGVHQDQRTAFFNHIRVTPDQPQAEALFSQRVTVQLTESLLYAPREAPTTSRIQRQTPAALTQIVWQPAAAAPSGPAIQHGPTTRIGPWRLTKSLSVEYDPALLGVTDPNARPDLAMQRLIAVRRTAFTVLVYVALQRLCQRFIQAGPPSWQQMVALMLRFQQPGREAADLSGEQGLYAAAQAIEQALGQLMRTRMQGMGAAGNKHQCRNNFNALLSAFTMDLQTPRPPTLERIGVLSFVTRPATAHPALTEDADQDFTLIGRTWLAHRRPDLPGYRLAAGPNLLALESGRETFPDSPTILKAIAELYQKKQCRHLLYLSHRWRGRRRGRAALRHRHHEQPAFLAEIRRRFPDLQLYPLVHDVFPATRLRQKSDQEDVFEMRDYQGILKAFALNEQPLRGDLLLIPLYILATLKVVGDQSSHLERPQSGFATYFLLGDPDPMRLEEESRRRMELVSADAPLRHDLLAILRGLHYLESEAATAKDQRVHQAGAPNAPKRNFVAPVLDPYAALQPSSIAAAGEIIVHPLTNRTAQVQLMLPAVLARIAGVLATHPDAGGARR